MALQKRTIEFIMQCKAVLEEYRPMTVRQVFYKLVGDEEDSEGLENTRNAYQRVSRALVKARQAHPDEPWHIPWEWVEDRLRRPRRPSMWFDLPEFEVAAHKAYKRDVFATVEEFKNDGMDVEQYFQPTRVEVWLEKDALSGHFDILRDYGVTLHVGRGFASWTSLKNMADEWRRWEFYSGKSTYCDSVKLLCFTDHDPSGWFMLGDLEERLAYFSAHPNIVRCALTEDDVDEYKLPRSITKDDDNRRDNFIALFGDVAVELDALPAAVLDERIKVNVEESMDMSCYENITKLQEEEREELRQKLGLPENSATVA